MEEMELSLPADFALSGAFSVGRVPSAIEKLRLRVCSAATFGWDVGRV